MKGSNTLSKNKENVYERQPVYEKVDVTSMLDGITKDGLIDLFSLYPDNAYIDVDRWYSETTIYIRYTRLETDAEYNKRIEDHKKKLAAAAKAKATKEEKAKLALIKKEEQERELYKMLKEKYGE